MLALSTPTQKKRTFAIGAIAWYGDHQVTIMDTRPTSSGVNYHRIKLNKNNLVLSTRVSANELK